MASGPVSEQRTAGGQPSLKRVMSVLLAIGIVLWAVTVLVTRRGGGATPRLDPSHPSGAGPSGPVD